MTRAPYQRNHPVFSWKKVPDPLVKAMVVARYADLGDEDEVKRIKKAGPRTIRSNIRHAFPIGSNDAEGRDQAPTDRQLDGAVFDTLLASWIGRLSTSALREVVDAMPRSVRRPGKGVDAPTLRRFIRRHQANPQLRKALKKQFRRAHRVDNIIIVKPSDGKEPNRFQTLQGRGHPQRNPWHDHQAKAREKLDELFAAGPTFAARLILPTGAGKTHTAAGWLLDRMVEEPSLRVMWLVHMQSLADQALTAFADLAEEQPASFTRRARVIHSDASARSTLADPDTDVVALTYQQLLALDTQQRDLIDRFFSRPTIVVVDEAHHAGSSSYERFLGHLADIPTLRGLIGLTATPPAGQGARHAFLQRFPTLIHQVGLIELIKQQILARPDITTVDTGIHFGPLPPPQQAAARTDDLPPAVLKMLNSRNRNEKVIATWKERPDHWGRTLVFAANIDHADTLHALLVRADANTRVLHSGSGNRSETLDWFLGQDGNAVLVSVGMLNEGVDLPKAETAFLVRATTSPVLMQQMIGRVLRGPKAKGSAEAHIVHFRDSWANLPDVLSPIELLPLRADRHADSGGDGVLPFLEDDELNELADIEAKLQQQFDMLSAEIFRTDAAPGASLAAPNVRDARLLGFYELDGFRIPVLDHQVDGFNALMDDAVRWAHSGDKRLPVLSYFDAAMPPVPLARSLELVRANVEEIRERLELHPLDAVVSPRAVAARIYRSELDDKGRWALIEAEYRRRFVRIAFPTLESFAEAVDRELRELRRPRRRPDVEAAVPSPTSPDLDRLPRAARMIKPIMGRVISRLPALIPAELADAVDRSIDLDWTPGVTDASFAHWSRKRSGKGAGNIETIRVNLLLKAPKRDVPDSVLEFLVYHEILHHLLPGNGHDSYFRELEGRWPGYMECNLFLDTLHEEWDTRPASYRRRRRRNRES